MNGPGSDCRTDLSNAVYETQSAVANMTTGTFVRLCGLSISAKKGTGLMAPQKSQGACDPRR